MLYPRQKNCMYGVVRSEDEEGVVRNEDEERVVRSEDEEAVVRSTFCCIPGRRIACMECILFDWPRN